MTVGIFGFIAILIILAVILIVDDQRTKSQKSAKENYLREHAFDEVVNEETNLYSAAEACNTSAWKLCCKENETTDKRKDLEDPLYKDKRAMLAVEYDHAMTVEEKARDDYDKKAAALREWKGQLSGKAKRYEAAISEYLRAVRDHKPGTKEYIWGSDDAMKWAEDHKVNP